MIMSGPSDSVAWSRKRCGIVSWMFLSQRGCARPSRAPPRQAALFDNAALRADGPARETCCEETSSNGQTSTDSRHTRMILPVQRIVRARIAEAVSALYGVAPDDPSLAAIVVDVPPRRALGDLAVPLAFELARRLRKAPKIIAQEIVGRLGSLDGFARIEAANGYINFFLDRVHHLDAWMNGDGSTPAATPEKAIVEHTAINPNKAAHIGHLR